jgi:Flp pilus assembly protein TadG
MTDMRKTPESSRGSIGRCGERGSQLLEMALALPFLLVFAVGISDFGRAYNLKHRISNAAREGARFSISQSPLDLTDSPPASIVATRNAVSNYLTNAGLTACAFGTTAPTSSGTAQWTISPKANCVLRIERKNTSVSVSGTPLESTQVTLTYPVTWTFNRIMGLLIAGANPTLPASLTSVSFMQNIT